MNIVLYLTHQIDMGWVFNSDVTQIPSFYKDLFVQGGSYSKLHLSASPYIFPDMFLYWLAILITPNAYFAALLFIILQLSLLLFSIYLIFKIYFDKYLSIKLASIIFAFLFLFPTSITPLFFISVFHIGEMQIGLYLLWFVLKCVKEKANYEISFLILLTSSLAYMSDGLYLLHFVLPLLATTFFITIIRQIEIKLSLILILKLLLIIYLGDLLYSLFIVHPSKPELLQHYTHMYAKAVKFWFIFYDFIESSILNTVIIIISFLLSQIVILKIFLRKIKKEFYFIALFLNFMLIANISSGMFLANNIADRYMIPVFIFPIIFLPIFLKDIFKFNSRLAIVLNTMIFCLLLFVIYTSIQKAKGKEFHTDYYPKTVQCFDEFIKKSGAKNGVAGYWLAKRVYTLTKNDDITLAQYLPDLTKFQWVSSDNWYKSNYSFFLIHHSAPIKEQKLDPNIIESRFGAADELINCPDMDILYYQKGVNL